MHFLSRHHAACAIQVSFMPSSTSAPVICSAPSQAGLLPCLLAAPLVCFASLGRRNKAGICVRDTELSRGGGATWVSLVLVVQPPTPEPPSVSEASGFFSVGLIGS